jgi:hypothetical protein
VSPEGQEVTAGPVDAGRSCPYCRFPIKEGAPIVVCALCHGLHHDDCWTDNAGCAIVGCASAPNKPSLPSPRLPVTPPAPATVLASPTVALPTTQHAILPPAHRSRHPRSLAALAAAALVLIAAGAVLFIVLDRSHHDHAGASAPRLSTSTESLTTIVRTETESQTAAVPVHLTTYQDPANTFSINYPSGWSTVENARRISDYVETKLVDPGRGSTTFLLIDHAPSYTGTLEQGASGVRAPIAKQPSYEQLAYGPRTFINSQGFLWQFSASGLEQMDTFYAACNGQIAVLVSAPLAQWPAYRQLYEDVMNSFTQTSCP